MSEHTMYIIGIFIFVLLIIIVRIYSKKSSVSCTNITKKKEKLKKNKKKETYTETSKDINVQDKLMSTTHSQEHNQWNLANAIRMFNEKQDAYIRKTNV